MLIKVFNIVTNKIQRIPFHPLLIIMMDKYIINNNKLRNCKQ